MIYDEIISLGSNCSPALSLRDLNLKQETYPFDWVRSNSKIIYDVILNGREKYLQFNMENISDEFYLKHLHSFTHPGFKKYVNFYGQHFTHFTNISVEELKDKINRQFDRFFKLLEGKKNILFVHTNEEYIYHKKSRDDREVLYEYLCKIDDLIHENYPDLNYRIINIDVDNSFKDYKNIQNINMEFKKKFSNSCEYHVPKFYDRYRSNVTKILRKLV